eukprot:scaffold77637_cov76-Phaeocystis_antarctica.AAC.1
MKGTCLRERKRRGGVHLCSCLPTPRSATVRSQMTLHFTCCLIMKTSSIVGAQPRGKVVCVGRRRSTNFGCGSRARACSGYVRASLAWCYLQEGLHRRVRVIYQS